MTARPIFDDDLRKAGFTSHARNFPRSEMSARWLAWYNGVRLEQIPPAWWYASNAWMHAYAEDQAFWAMQDGMTAPATPHKRGSVNDWSKVRIIDGVIHYGIYQQDGSMQPMTAPDTMHNRQIVSWIQIHDRNVGYPGAKA